MGGLLTNFTGKILYCVVGLSMIVTVVLLVLAEAPWRSNRAAVAGDSDIEDIAALRRRRLLEEEGRRLSMVDIL